MPRPIVLDMDTGTDDALAILYAVRYPDLEVRAISCVAGVFVGGSASPEAPERTGRVATMSD